MAGDYEQKARAVLYVTEWHFARRLTELFNTRLITSKGAVKSSHPRLRDMVQAQPLIHRGMYSTKTTASVVSVLALGCAARAS